MQERLLGYERVPGVLPTPGGGRTLHAVAGTLTPAEGPLLASPVSTLAHDGSAGFLSVEPCAPKVEAGPS